jgi:hypothetical protein
MCHASASDINKANYPKISISYTHHRQLSSTLRNRWKFALGNSYLEIQIAGMKLGIGEITLKKAEVWRDGIINMLWSVPSAENS